MLAYSTPRPLLRILARKALLRARWSDVVDWAVDALVAGLDSPSLPILAGLSSPVFAPEVEHYLDRVLAEFGWTVPGETRLLEWYATDVAARIVADELTAQAGSVEIHHVYVALNYPRWLGDWSYCEFEYATDDPREVEALVQVIKERARLFIPPARRQ